MVHRLTKLCLHWHVSFIKETLSVLMLCAPVFIFTSGSSALLGRPRCGLSIWLSLLAILNTLFWVYANLFHEKTDKTRKSPPFSYPPKVTRRAKHYTESFFKKLFYYVVILKILPLTIFVCHSVLGISCTCCRSYLIKEGEKKKLDSTSSQAGKDVGYGMVAVLKLDIKHIARSKRHLVSTPILWVTDKKHQAAPLL